MSKINSFLTNCTQKDLDRKLFACKTLKAHDKQERKLQLAVDATWNPLIDSMADCLETDGYGMMVGSAPRAGLERDMQTLVDKIYKTSKGKKK